MSYAYPLDIVVRYAHANALMGTEVSHKNMQRYSGRNEAGRRGYSPDEMLNIRAALAGTTGEAVRAAMAANKKAPTFIVTRMTKGGVGKTSLTVNLACAIAMSGYRVLLIDADHQSTASSMLGVDEEIHNQFHIGKLLAIDSNTVPDDLTPYIRPVIAGGFLDLIASDVELDSYNNILFMKAHRELAAVDFARRNNEFLAKNYDVVMVDTNPGTSQISMAFTFLGALSKRILTVVEPEGSCLRALNALRFNLEELRTPVEPTIILNKVTIGRKRAEENMKLLQDNYANQILPLQIPQSVTFNRQVNADDVSASAPVVIQEPNSKAAAVLFDLSRMVLQSFQIKQPGF